ncbi:MAG: MFS transporter [Candidatus Gracilibacteria bacterium]|jgi:HEAT repeat protein/ATP/ADP translocase|nr:MFS transporter [Candidatus Gracilibacteria bacterium]
MKTKIKKIREHFLLHVFNISHHELSRVVISWGLKFLLQVGTIIGATLLTALFVDEFGVSKLPSLYILQSTFLIASVFVFSPLAERMKKEDFILCGIGVSVTFFLLLFLLKDFHFLFFGVFIMTLSVVIAQLTIVMSLFTEDLFTPLESVRTFPVIESSEPIGSLCAGVLIVGATKYFHVESLFLIAAFSIGLMLPILLYYKQVSEAVPILRSKEEIHEKVSKKESLQRLVKHAKIIPFLKILVTLVFLHFAAFNILEFQFTKAVDAHVSNNHGDHGLEHTSALTHGLGTVHVFISAVLLGVQIFLSSRTMKKIGIVKTISLNPIFSGIIFSLFTFNFTFIFAVGAKTIFEATGAMFRNAHQVSFFSLKEKVRAHAKEFIEGISKPLGAISGTLVIFLMQFLFHGKVLDYALNTTLVITAFTMFTLSSRLSEKYTLLARKNLEMQGAPQEKMDAIEVLSQKGHKNAVEILTKELTFRKDCPEVKVKIIRTLGILRDPKSIPTILKSFKDGSIDVQIEAVKSLSKFKNLGEHFLSQSFAKYHVSEALKSLFLKTRSKKLKTEVVHAFTNIKDADIVPFLLDVINSKDEEIRAEGIFACGLFHDPTIAFYVEKYLEDKSARVRSNTIIALWQFVELRLKLIVKLMALLDSKDTEEVLSGIFAVGEIRFASEKERLMRFLENENEDIRRHAALALGKINHDHSIGHIIDFIWHNNKKTSLKTKHQIKELHPQIKERVNRHMVKEATHRITKILHEAKTEILEDLEDAALKELLHIFTLIDEEKEVLKIKNIIENKKQAKKQKTKPQNFDIDRLLAA